jgi:GrpB-like predicted nucleotidyltransferase (UPF0157 family)
MLNGTMAVRITIADYDPRWPELFESEKQRLWESLGHHIVHIEHIGSTAVPGLAAKPVIDMMVGVESLKVADAFCLLPIIDLGYEYVKGLEKKLPLQRYFRRDNSEGIRTHHIHLVEFGTDWWRHYLVFRDCLRSHVEARTAYENLKRELAQKDWESGLEYADAKTAFVEGVISKALESGVRETH